MMIFGGVGAGGSVGVGVVGQEGQWEGARKDKELGPGVPDARGEEMAGGRRARWQGWWGTRLMAGSQMGQGQGGPDGQEGGDGRVHDGQMAVAGGSGGSMEQEFKMVGRQVPRAAMARGGRVLWARWSQWGTWGGIPDRG